MASRRDRGATGEIVHERKIPVHGGYYLDDTTLLAASDEDGHLLCVDIASGGAGNRDRDLIIWNPESGTEVFSGKHGKGIVD